MRTRTWTAACAALTFGVAVGLAAQTAPGAAAQQHSSASSSDKVMVTGCLERATPTPTATSGTRGAAASDFVLTHATMSTGAGSNSVSSSSNTTTSPGAAGTTGSPSSATSGKEYQLDATDAQLSQHAGHKVEVTGSIEQPGASASARTNPPAASASASSSGESKLKVDSIRMISTTCS